MLAGGGALIVMHFGTPPRREHQRLVAMVMEEVAGGSL